MLAAKKPKHKKEQYCNKFSKDFKNGPHQKKKKEREYHCSASLQPLQPYSPISSMCFSIFLVNKELSMFLHCLLQDPQSPRKSGKQTTSEYLTYKTSDIDKGHEEKIYWERELLKGNN